MTASPVPLAPGLPLPSRPRVAVGAVVAVLAVTAALACALTLTAYDAWGLPANSDQPVDLAASLGFSVMGAVVLAGRAPSSRMGWLLLGPGAASAVNTVCATVASVADRVTPAARAAAFGADTLWVLGIFPLLTLVPLLYPDGRLLSRRWRPVVITSVVGTVTFMAGTVLGARAFVGRVRIEPALAGHGVADVLVVVAAVLLVPSVLASLSALLLRLRRSTGLARRQVAVLLSAAAVFALDLLVQPALPEGSRTAVQALAVALLPVAIGVAVTRHRLFDLDVALCRSLLAVSLAACVAGTYLTLFTVLDAAFSGRTALAPAVAAGVTGLLVHAMAVRLSRGADRLLYGEQANPFVVVSRLGTVLRGGVEPAEVPRVVEQTVRTALQLGSVRLLLEGPPADQDMMDPAGETVDLVHRDEVVGHLVVTPRAGERSLHDRDRVVLEAVADQVAPVVTSLRAFARLRASRESLVAAREEERHRLRRDLHDGVGAALAGVRLQLESARVRVDDAQAARLLDAAGAGVAEAVRDVRQVTDDLRPAGLDELGLARSVRALADRFGTDRVLVTASVDPLPELVPAVEVACYRIAAEAVANAVRHSGSGQVRLHVGLEGRWLRLVVEDDGCGLPERPRPGSLGLTSMRQRAEEIGGRLHLGVLASGAGTQVLAELPTDLG